LQITTAGWDQDSICFEQYQHAKGVQSGVLSINANASVHTEAPFGGYKASGVGRELGMHALDEYTEIKNVFVDLR